MLTKDQKLIRARAALAFVQSVGRKPTPAELERQIKLAPQHTVQWRWLASLNRNKTTRPSLFSAHTR